MTFFKSKGLEFPVVILYNLEHKINTNKNAIFKKNNLENFNIEFTAKFIKTKILKFA